MSFLGRPRKYLNRYIAQLPIEREDYETFQGIAATERTTPTDLIQSFIKDYNHKHKRGNPAFKMDGWLTDPQLKALPTLGEEPGNYPHLKDPKTASEINLRARIWMNATTPYLSKGKAKNESISVCRHCGIEVDYIGHPVKEDHTVDCPTRKIRESNKVHLEKLRKEKEQTQKN